MKSCAPSSAMCCLSRPPPPGGPRHLSATAASSLFNDHRLVLARADSTEQRQLDRQAQRIDAEGEPQQVQFEPFFPAGNDARDTEHIDLSARAAGRERNGHHAEV